LAEKRHGLCRDVRVAVADGHAERQMAAAMLRRFRRRHRRSSQTVGAEAGYEAGKFLQTLEEDLKIESLIDVR
jgi:hypothetical protein